MASRVQDVIRRGTRGAQPAATAVITGTLYYVTDEFVTERSNGTTWDTYADVAKYSLGVTVDGAGSPPSTGIKGYRSIQITGTIVKVRLLADQTGSVVFDIWNDTYGNYPPTVADTITAAAKPTLSTAIKYEDATLTGWTTAVTAGDVLGFNVDSVTTLTRVSLELEISIP